MIAAPMSNRSKHMSWVSIGALLIVVIGIGYIYLRGQGRDQDAKTSETENQITAAQIQEVCAQGGMTAKKLWDEGICDRTRKIVEHGPRGEQGIPGISIVGPQGLRGPQGPQGERGPQGLPGNSPQCLLIPTRCEGPRGLAGQNGTNGIDGQNGTNGIDGKSCTPDIEGCRGPQGVSGTDGKNGTDGQDGINGKDGRGIQSITCPDDNDPTTADPFLITYTDNTTQVVENSQCRPATTASNSTIKRK